MKLSRETIEVLKNFATINTNMVFIPGTTLKTISAIGNIYAVAEIEESFDTTFGIYDLTDFLNVHNITDNAELNIYDKYMDMSWGSNNIKYLFTDPELIDEDTLKKLNRNIKFTDSIIELNISSSVIKTASVLRSTNMAIICKDGVVKMKLMDKDNPLANSFEQVFEDVVCETNMEAYIDINSLKLINGEYSLQISSKGLSCFQNLDRPVKYYITLDTASKFA